MDVVDATATLVMYSAMHLDEWGTSAGDDAGVRAAEAAYTKRLHLFRDIFGNSIQATAIDPAWLTWNGRTVPQLARAIYEERTFDRMPILADALEEAGCTDSNILDHCRGPGPHVRGCWVVDLLLGKR